jgi:uncharacterized delta-60 repeat protein
VERLEDRALPSFLTPVNYATDANPRSAVVGDFNGDGVLDIAVVNGDSNTVNVFLGNGDATFQAARSMPIGAHPLSAAVGDFNGDGKLDLVVADNYAGGPVQLLVGNGDGTFQAPINVFSDPSFTPLAVAVGALKKNGKLDLVITGQVSSSTGSFGEVVVLPGEGNGSFGKAASLPVGTFPNSVVLDDFNNDGTLDAAVTDSALGTVDILLGKGDGTLGPPVSFATGAPADTTIADYYLAAGDFNGDGKLDIVTANRGNNTVSVLLGNGDGTFQTAVTYPVGASGPQSVAVGDFFRDGKLDIVAANVDDSKISVLLGKGDGTFSTPMIVPTGSGANSLAVAKFDGHYPDLAVTNWISKTLSILTSEAGDLDPSFGTGGEVTTTFPPNSSAQASAVVIQPDGKTVVAGTAKVFEPGSGEVALARYNPDGSLDPSFGTGGQVVTTGNGLSTGGLALQADGKIVVVAQGSNSTGTQMLLIRYLPDGSLDSGFGTAGEVTLNNAGGSSIVILPDGKIVAAGINAVNTTANLTETVARFNPDGSLDSGFGTGGMVGLNSGGASSGLALQADGKILVAFGSEVARLNADGSLDSLFGNSGEATVGFGVSGGPAVQPDGRIVVVGNTGTYLDFAIAVGRLNTNGTLDATFGAGGSVSTGLGPGTNGLQAFGVAIQPDGRIVVAGNTGGGYPLGYTSFELIRYNPNGSLDGSFGTGGEVTTTFTIFPSASPSAVALQPDGKIVAAGVAVGPNGHALVPPAFAVARYLGDAPIADPNQRFVTHVYLDLLGHMPDSYALSFWTGVLSQGTTRTQLVQMIESSQEYHTDELEYLYGYVLGRAADPLGLSAWSNFLAQGGTAEQLEAILYGSGEFFAGRGGGTNATFLQSLYQNALGRSIDSGGAQSWGQALAAGATRTVVADGILGSQESDMDEVQLLYLTILHRPADTSGLSFFTSLLQQGVPNEAVLAALAGSSEYFARP